MSLDIKHRPWKYEQVLGQGPTITILKQYVASGRGFEQSYLFCGGRGQGKTTLGRIHARALLCEHPVKGEPCDQCVSCRTLLQDGSSLDYIEVDAATNSGKAEIDRIKEDIQYSSFSGRQRIYLFDEAHQLTKDALDGLLKPTEDNIPGTNNKWLVCIFCTTEPEKMRATVLSRCAPAFVIEPQPPEVLAQHFARICELENIPFEPEALQLVAEITECHVRDGLKAIEGVSMLGPLTKENVSTYLHLDLNSSYLELLVALGQDLPRALDLARRMMQKVSPTVCYERLADAAMAAFRVHLGVRESSHWPQERLQVLAAKGPALLGYVDRLASRPGRPTAAMLMCDLSLLHHGGGANCQAPVVFQVVPPPSVVSPVREPPPQTVAEKPPSVPASTQAQAAPSGMRNDLTEKSGSIYYTNPKAVAAEAKPRGSPKKGDLFILTPEVFSEHLALTLAEMRSLRRGGSPR